MVDLKGFTDTSRVDLKSLNVEEQLALLNYYCNMVPLYKKCGKKSNVPKFTKRIIKPCIKRLEVYQDLSFDKFILCKDFHKAYLSEVLLGLGEELGEFEIDKLQIPLLSDDEFWTILRDFLNSINSLDIFEELYKGNRIYFKNLKSENDNGGAILFNPLNGDMDVFVRSERKDYLALISLVHEIGHAVDFRRLTGDAKTFNEYFYSSFYLETVPQLFEKLFIRYLSRNGLLKGREEFFINELLLKYDILLVAFVCSLLDQKDFKDGFIKLSDEKLAKKLGNIFREREVFLETLNNVESRDFNKIYNYAYGDILSTFLLDSFEEEGFSSELFNYFLENRTKLFGEGYLRECGFGPKSYLKLYKKDLELVKK